VGLHSGSLVLLSGGGGPTGSEGWSILRDMGRCHGGPLRLLRAFPADSGGAPPAQLEPGAELLVASAGDDLTLRVWQLSRPAAAAAAVGVAGAADPTGGIDLRGGVPEQCGPTALTSLVATSRASMLLGAATDGSVSCWSSANHTHNTVPSAPPPKAGGGVGAGASPAAPAPLARLRSSAPVNVHRGAPPGMARRSSGSFGTLTQSQKDSKEPSSTSS
jgi:hypothetical protein